MAGYHSPGKALTPFRESGANQRVVSFGDAYVGVERGGMDIALAGLNLRPLLTAVAVNTRDIFVSWRPSTEPNRKNEHERTATTPV